MFKMWLLKLDSNVFCYLWVTTKSDGIFVYTKFRRGRKFIGMNIEEFREYCLSKKFVTECFPFDETTLVFKVAEKMFSLSGLEHQPSTVNLKCDPERAIELRAEYDDIIEGYHMSKKHWNTITIESNIPNTLIKELVDHSYDLVVKGMTIKRQKELGFI